MARPRATPNNTRRGYRRPAPKMALPVTGPKSCFTYGSRPAPGACLRRITQRGRVLVSLATLRSLPHVRHGLGKPKLQHESPHPTGDVVQDEADRREVLAARISHRPVEVALGRENR